MLQLAACLEKFLPKDGNPFPDRLQFAKPLPRVNNRSFSSLARFLALHNFSSQCPIDPSDEVDSTSGTTLTCIDCVAVLTVASIRWLLEDGQGSFGGD